jgi:RHS repeat-associated protein
VISFMRGIDISGSFQRGGGVGGLVAINNVTNGVHFCAYDGNGNISRMMSAETGSFSGVYEFDSFGNTLRLSGTAAKANPIRFSTQLANDLRAVSKYLYRDFYPSIGRWVSRDPIGERGGRNLFAYIRNEPLSDVDVMGLAAGKCGCVCEEVTISAADEIDTQFRDGPPPEVPQAPNHVLIGIQVNYTIKVRGNPEFCECEYVDSGSIGWVTAPPPDIGILTFGNGPGEKPPIHAIDCKDGGDHPGLRLAVGPDAAEISYTLDYNWTGTVNCYSAPGFASIPMSASTSINGRFEGIGRWDGANR